MEKVTQLMSLDINNYRDLKKYQKGDELVKVQVPNSGFCYLLRVGDKIPSFSFFG